MADLTTYPSQLSVPNQGGRTYGHFDEGLRRMVLLKKPKLQLPTKPGLNKAMAALGLLASAFTQTLAPLHSGPSNPGHLISPDCARCSREIARLRLQKAPPTDQEIL